MMVTAQRADRSAGNLPGFKCDDNTKEELTPASLDIQVLRAAADSIGLCIFGRSITNENIDFIVDALS